MGRYRPLFTLRIEHEFYGSGPCPAVLPRAHGAGGALRSAEPLVHRAVPGQAIVLFDEERYDVLVERAASRSDPLRVVFVLEATDPDLWSYSALAPPGAPSVPYYDSASAEAEGNELVWDAVTKIGHGGAADPPDLGSSLPLPPSGLGGIVVRVAPEDLPSSGSEVGERRYVLRIPARRTVWKYYLLGDLARSQAVIEDVSPDNRERVVFGPSGREVLPGDRLATTITSTVPIPLVKRSPYRFQLRENGRVLVKRLPTASPGLLSLASTPVEAPDGGALERAGRGGPPTVVSEIYVNG